MWVLRGGGEVAAEQPLDVLGDDVGLEVDQVAHAAGAERRTGEGLGNEADGEGGLADLDDGEADAVDGDRALVDEVAREVGRQGDLDDVPVLAGRAGDDLADAVHVARTMPLAPETAKRQRGRVKGIDDSAFFDPLPEEELAAWERR